MNKTLGLLVFSLLTAQLHAEKGPNILFLFADDLGRYASPYANPAHPSPNDITHTPAFERIAKDGAAHPPPALRNLSSLRLSITLGPWCSILPATSYDRVDGVRNSALKSPAGVAASEK